MLTLNALSCGYLVQLAPAQLLGVHSQFQHALNLRDGNGALITLLDSRYPDLPTGIRVAAPAQWDWRNTGKHPVTLRHGVLSGFGWALNINTAQRWQPQPLPVPDIAAIAAAYPVLTRLLTTRSNTKNNKFDLLTHLINSNIKLDIFSSTQLLQSESSQLIGFGNGLTPDGDDYLVGYLAFLSIWHHKPIIDLHLRSLRKHIAGLLHGTTEISQHYLALVLRGHYSQPLHDLTGSVMNRAPEAEINAQACKVMQMGASSGISTLTGYLHGMRNLLQAFQQKTADKPSAEFIAQGQS